MKKVYCVVLGCCLLVAGAAAVQAAERAPLGNINVAVKIDSFHFLNEDMKESDADTATYVGLEGYGSVAPNWYLGGEVGYAHSKGNFVNIEVGRIDTEVTFIPVEVNLRYAVAAGRKVSIDFGGGLSYNRVDYQAKARVPWFGLPPAGESTVMHVPDSLMGGQFFTDVNFTFGPVFIGLNAKFQLVALGKIENFQGSSSYDAYTNWRAGGQIGARF